MATKNNPGPNDCYKRAEPDEPMFTLLGRDPCASMLVLTWIRMRRALGGSSTEQLEEARVCAHAMAAWATVKLNRGEAVDQAMLAFERACCDFAGIVAEEYKGSLREDVREFHEKFDIPVLDSPQVPPVDRITLRCDMLWEETREFLDACFLDGADYLITMHDAFIRMKQECKVSVQIEDAADALIDSQYIAEGGLLEMGIDSRPLLSEVHRANMAKTGGGKRADGKVAKPEGWVAPDVHGVLARQGMKTPAKPA